jgi:hypothetical protein
VPLLSGINKVQLLRHGPLPALNYHPASATSSSTPYQHNPERVVPWERVAGTSLALRDAILHHTATQPASGSFAAPVVPTATAYYGTELGAHIAALCGVVSPVNELLQDGGECCGVTSQHFCWVAQRSSRPPGSQDHTAFIPVDPGTKPVFELIHKESKAVQCTIQVERR